MSARPLVAFELSETIDNDWMIALPPTAERSIVAKSTPVWPLAKTFDAGVEASRLTFTVPL